MKVTSLMLVGFVFAAAGCVSQTTTEPMSVADSAEYSKPTEQVADTGESKQICRSERVIGSKFNKRVCYTQEEWDIMQERTEEARQRLRKTIRSQSKCGDFNC